MSKAVGPGNRRDWRCKLCDESGGGGRGPNRASQKAVALHVAMVYGKSDWHGVHANWKRIHGLPIETMDRKQAAASARIIMERYIHEVAERNTDTLPPKVSRLMQYVQDHNSLAE